MNSFEGTVLEGLTESKTKEEEYVEEPKCIKTRFKSVLDADTRIKEIRIEDKEKNANKINCMSSYKCEICGYYHLTTGKDKVRRRRKKAFKIRSKCSK